MPTLEHLYREWLDASRRDGDVLQQAEELIGRGAPVPAELLAEMTRLEVDVKAKLEAFARAAEGPDRLH